MNDGWSWLIAGLSVVGVAGYEIRLRYTAHHNPAATAGSVHRIMRGEWVEALSRHPGSEILAVQALRNSLMSATINASTAVLVLMGSISLMVSRRDGGPALPAFSLRLALEFALVSTLCAAYVCAAIAMRYYNNAGFAMSLPVGSPERVARELPAASYVQRAGILYSWSLRCFLYAIPVAVGLLSPPCMPVASVALIIALTLFDRAPQTDG